MRLIWNNLLVADGEGPLRLERLDEREQKMLVANELLKLHHRGVVVGSGTRQTALQFPTQNSKNE